MVDLPPPVSRREQQRLTRERLVFAARAAFARDGYHGANLEAIAREAGFSKGAVYSNFESKAALFLAVMDENIALVAGRADGEAGAGSGAADVVADQLAVLVTGRPEFDAAVRGFALATLEFIAVAARDEQLLAESGKRLALLVEGYARLADDVEDPDGLSRTTRGALLAALDQGSAVLAVAGLDTLSEQALELGMRRLRGDAAAGLGSDASRPALHSAEVRRRIAEGLAPHVLGPG